MSNVKALFVSALATLSVMAWVWTRASDLPRAPEPRTPIMVELFTSEGCSSCPPADALLARLDLSQPVPGAELVVLSEHVDYWNHIGWKDPYSSAFYSDRQSGYATRFGLGSVYTPQMVVDGASEFVGSDSGLADQAFAKALTVPKIRVRLSSIALQANSVQAHVETEAFPASFGSKEAEVYVAVALNHAESQVSGGENAGRRLTHVAVVRNLVKVGSLRRGASFAKDLLLKLDPGSAAQNLRLIAFVQEPHQGRIMGATMQAVGK